MFACMQFVLASSDQAFRLVLGPPARTSAHPCTFSHSDKRVHADSWFSEPDLNVVSSTLGYAQSRFLQLPELRPTNPKLTLAS